MDLFDAIKSRRSHRAFKQQAVEQEKIDAILEAGHWAPSPANNQPWEFVLVTGKEARQRLYELSEQAKRTGNIAIRGFSYIRPLPAQEAGTPAAGEGGGGTGLASGEGGAPDYEEALRGYSLLFLKSVPVIIGVVGLPATATRQLGQETAESYRYACGAAIENMLLAATALGLGSLWFTLFDEQLMRRFLGIGPDRRLVALVCIGYPAMTPPSPGRLPLSSKVRRLG